MSRDNAKALLLRDALELGCTTKAQRQQLIIKLLLSGEPLSQDVREVMAKALSPKNVAGRNKKSWDWPLALYVAGLLRREPSSPVAVVCSRERAGLSREAAEEKAAEAFGVRPSTARDAYSALLAAQREAADVASYKQ